MATISAGQLMTYAEQQALAAVFLKTQSPAAGTVYGHLLTNATSGSVDNTWTLVSSGTVYGASGYTPQSVAQNTPTVASPSVISNSATVTWGPTSSSPGTTVNWVAVGSTSTPGTANFIAALLLGTPRTPVSGDSLQAAATTGLTCQV